MAGYQSAYWERSSGEGFTPPQPTYTGGTAVQRAVEPDGTEWEYDNTSNQWVNLKSGEALAPKDFAIRAGRTGNAASDTKALADEMRREEAQLTAPLVRQPVTPPMPAVRPPSTFYSPSGVARVRGQQPMPSTQIPATQEAWNAALARDPQGAANFFKARQLMDNYEYNQSLQRLIAGGMTHEEAVRKLGPMPFGMGKSVTPQTRSVAGVGLVDPSTGRIIVEQPQRPISVANVGLVDPKTGKILVAQPSRLPPVSAGVRERYRSLVNAETAAKLSDTKDSAMQLARAMRERQAFEREHPEILGRIAESVAPTTTTISGAQTGKEITDKDGKKWIYLGTNPNPLTDREQSHWIPK